MNIRDMIDLETGSTWMEDVPSVDAKTTTGLLNFIENACATMPRTRVHHDNARFHPSVPFRNS